MTLDPGAKKNCFFLLTECKNLGRQCSHRKDTDNRPVNSKLQHLLSWVYTGHLTISRALGMPGSVKLKFGIDQRIYNMARLCYRCILYLMRFRLSATLGSVAQDLTSRILLTLDVKIVDFHWSERLTSSFLQHLRPTHLAYEPGSQVSYRAKRKIELGLERGRKGGSL